MKYSLKYFFTFMILALFAFSCDYTPSSDQIQKEQTEKALQEAAKEVGHPAIVNWQEKKMVKELIELRDQENVLCYAYIVSMSGKLVFLGKCYGYGIPYSTQFSNPEKKMYEHGTYGTLPQAEPNGLFMPDGLAATWLHMIDPEGNVRPVYIEPEIIVSPYPMHNG